MLTFSYERARGARFSFLFLALMVAGAGCTSPTSPTHPTTLTIVDLNVGTGAEAKTELTLMVNYKGYLYDPTKPDSKGTLFDENEEGFPFVFKLGVGQVIEGWDKGILGMKVGGRRRLTIPPELAYGRVGAGNVIPPNASLVFDIELISVAGAVTGG
jgi:FKBP-type peptidyl-prolyl cis-trans isomerase FkpA